MAYTIIGKVAQYIISAFEFSHGIKAIKTYVKKKKKFTQPIYQTPSLSCQAPQILSFPQPIHLPPSPMFITSSQSNSQRTITYFGGHRLCHICVASTSMVSLMVPQSLLYLPSLLSPMVSLPLLPIPFLTPSIFKINFS